MTLAHTPPNFPQIVNVGLTGLLINFSDQLTSGSNQAALALRAAIDNIGIKGIVETTTSLASAFVVYDPLTLSQDRLREHIMELLKNRDWETTSLSNNRKLWRIPAVFDDFQHGPQLAEAAEMAGVDYQTAIEELCHSPLRVMTIGFAPGQPYLGSLPENWDIPRQTGVTKQVPVGAITVAIKQIVLFSTASPTGWRQVGQCAFRAFRPEQENPFALTPGDEIWFYPVSAQALAGARADDTTGNGGATWDALP